MVWRVESTGARAGEADKLAESVRAGRKTAVYGPDGCGKTSLLGDVARRLGEQAVLVRVPAGLDQVEAVAVHIAAALGNDALREVDAALREHAEEIEPSLNVLSRHLGGHLVVVDDIDAFTAEGSHDLRGVAGRRGAPLSAWLRQRAALYSSADPPEKKARVATRIKPLRDPPLRLLNGQEQAVGSTWHRVGRDPATFRLALTLAQIEEHPPGEIPGHVGELVEDVWSEMPASYRPVLELLAVHGRPLSVEVLRAVPMANPAGHGRAGASGAPPLLDQVRSLAVVEDDGGSLRLEGPLQRFCRTQLTPEARAHAHLTLAAAFAGEFRGDEPGAWSKAASLLEAHRHYVGGGQPDRALQLARYGVLLLARERSLRGRPEDRAAAAAIYAEVLKRPAADLGPWAWAYAKHYLHYNRYKALPDLVEPASETEVGYRASVDKWPANALFWSRLSLTQFLQGDRGRAFGTLEKARKAVPDHIASRHTGKEWYLRCRTTQHLLRFDPPQVAEALRVWGSYTPRDLRERDVEQALAAALSQGFRTRVLEAPEVATVHLHRDVEVKIVAAGQRFACTLGELCVSARAPDRVGAFIAAIKALRDQTDRFRQAPTHRLAPDERAQKQRLLGGVDLVASRLLGEIPKETWIIGKIVQKDGAWVVREVGSHAGIFALDIDEPLDPARVPDTHPRLVRVRAGTAGEPVGPVIELGEPLGLDPERLWAEWKKRLGEVDHG